MRVVIKVEVSDAPRGEAIRVPLDSTSSLLDRAEIQLIAPLWSGFLPIWQRSSTWLIGFLLRYVPTDTLRFGKLQGRRALEKLRIPAGNDVCE